ncbi:MAG TPA: sugar phosphate isomerase/epimerase [Phycisphaerales bacterium]|nr:sugar phosphate isomerase/epimerase [Phycisphaerales bacterium]
MKCDKWDIGVCSWSLQTDVDGVAAAMKDIGIGHVHLAVGPALEEGGQEYLAAVKAQDWTVSCTMIGFPQEDYSTLDTIKVTGGIVPDDNWSANKKLFSDAAEATKALGVKYLSMHAGFIDHNDTEKYQAVHERIRSLGDIVAANGIMLLMETGQETAEEMASFLKDMNHPAVGINFDPANMILYDKGDPIEAVKILAPWIKHVHIKDANRTATTGQWGCEVPWGEGQVCSDKFLDTLAGIGYEGTLAIEREAGDDRTGDIRLAVKRLQS